MHRSQWNTVRKVRPVTWFDKLGLIEQLDNYSLQIIAQTISGQVLCILYLLCFCLFRWSSGHLAGWNYFSEPPLPPPLHSPNSSLAGSLSEPALGYSGPLVFPIELWTHTSSLRLSKISTVLSWPRASTQIRIASKINPFYPFLQCFYPKQLALFKPTQTERFTALYLNAAARKRAEKESNSTEELEAAMEKEDSTEGKDWGIMPTLQMNLGLLSKSIGILGGLRLENDNNQVAPATAEQ